ncbi:hypothetical protein ACLQ2Q_22140 [Microbacterium sp. DT81.1]|uniref:hypothetical protein n=1 Tax=Microbacterium sp. DT81.1 TaxID=3393413 RepID=UPI003CFA3AA7
MNYAKLPWDDIVNRAKRAQGSWILGAQAVPESVLRTVRQGRNKKVTRLEGRLVPRGTAGANTPNGVKVVDLYVRWEWTPGFEPSTPDAIEFSKRSVTLPVTVAEAVRSAAADRGESVDDILPRAIEELAVRGTTYREPPPSPPSRMTFLVNDDSWDRAQDRVEEVGVSFGPAMVLAVRRQIGRTGQADGPSLR